MNARNLKPMYERPSILRHRSGLMNKMGATPGLAPQPDIDGVDVEELIQAYGSPLFVYSEQTILDTYTELRDQLSRRYPHIQLAWSYKTCYLEAVCRLYHQQGSWAEVVSAMEYAKARRHGVPTEKIVYNGPMKCDESLREALAGGSKVHIDHFDELAACERIADEMQIRPKVALRLNINTKSQAKWDRFGFNLDTGQAWDAVRRLVAGGKLQLDGLHMHLGTFIQDTRAYNEATSKLCAFANRLRNELGITLSYLDLGGGFASKSRLRGQYLPGEANTPPLSRYAEAIADALSTLCYPPDQLPLIILETGRALIDDAGTLITSVKANKRLADGRRSVVVDAGVNVLFTAYWYQHKLTPTRETHGAPEPTMVYGPMCMNIDVVGNNLQLPPLPVGSRLLVHPVGAYNVTQSMQFIQLRPAVCLVRPDGSHHLIRRAEVLLDLIGPEVVPEFLQGSS
ncbi:MAG: diaminopimelate decarboxylase [Kiritimatiellia bacterium]|jgi:diaminopimelate decarboxylase